MLVLIYLSAGCISSPGPATAIPGADSGSFRQDRVQSPSKSPSPLQPRLSEPGQITWTNQDGSDPSDRLRFGFIGLIHHRAPLQPVHPVSSRLPLRAHTRSLCNSSPGDRHHCWPILNSSCFFSATGVSLHNGNFARRRQAEVVTVYGLKHDRVTRMPLKLFSTPRIFQNVSHNLRFMKTFNKTSGILPHGKGITGSYIIGTMSLSRADKTGELVMGKQISPANSVLR